MRTTLGTIKAILITSILFINVLSATPFIDGDNGPFSTVDSLNADYLNWYNLDPELDNAQGVSVNRAYDELLKGRSPKKKIVVAVIDGGTDIYHEDLKDKIWINKNEIPNNGIDDDKNGNIKM